jgi:hypothetical protein
MTKNKKIKKLVSKLDKKHEKFKNKSDKFKIKFLNKILGEIFLNKKDIKDVSKLEI